MKISRFEIISFLIFLALIILIDLPENLPVKLPFGKKAIVSSINPPHIDITLFDKHIKKDFKTQLGLDLKGGSHLVFEANIADIKPADRGTALEGARNIIERRVNFFGVAEPSVQSIQSGNAYRIIVDLPGAQNIAEAVSLIGQTARLEFTELASDEAKIATDTPLFLQVRKKTDLTGKHVKRASVEFDSKGKPAVGLQFDSEGAKLFEQITTRNIGRPVGIFLDGFPLSIPTVQQAITGGDAVITGNFTVDDAKKLAVSINSGALPVSIKLIEQRNIGPSLGEEQIKKSIFAGVVGLSTVILFMILYYGRLGIIASMALLIYGLISFAVVRAVPVVLTLPGIAGFILSIGMAVDSNILIFERIKEEKRLGRDFDIAVRLGFGKAIDAIKDANITTILVALILFNPLNSEHFPQFGLVKGFALTLIIGVVTSLFTGVFITRRLIALFYKKSKKSV